MAAGVVTFADSGKVCALAAAPVVLRSSSATLAIPTRERPMKRTHLRRAMFATALGVAMVTAMAATLPAQTNEEFDKILPFLAGWSAQVSSPDGQDRGNCAGRQEITARSW